MRVLIFDLLLTKLDNKDLSDGGCRYGRKIYLTTRLRRKICQNNVQDAVARRADQVDLDPTQPY